MGVRCCPDEAEASVGLVTRRDGEEEARLGVLVTERLMAVAVTTPGARQQLDRCCAAHGVAARVTVIERDGRTHGA